MAVIAVAYAILSVIGGDLSRASLGLVAGGYQSAFSR